MIDPIMNTPTTSTTPTTNSIKADSTGIVASGGHHFDEAKLLPEEVAAFQIGIWQLFEKQALLYTSGESSSVPELTAYRLFSSICYVLDVDPDDPDPQRVRSLLDEGMDEVFARSVDAIGASVARTSALWERVCVTTPLLESTALKDTLESLRNFSARYDYRSFAHEIPCDIDYPLCHPVRNTTRGVDYVIVYLERLLIENRVMQCFDIDQCRRLLKAVDPDYRELIINVFEPLATNSIGVALLNGDPVDLRFTQEMAHTVDRLFAETPKKKSLATLQHAAARTCLALGISDNDVHAYMKKLAAGLYPRIQAHANPFIVF